MFRVEIAKALRRRRTWMLALAIASVPVIMVVAFKVSPPSVPASADGAPFLAEIGRNGLFAALAGLAIVQPVLLSVAAGLVSGDAIAGEAQTGTLRYLLVRPVGRSRLVVAKYASGMAMLGALVAITIVVGLMAGAMAFEFGPLPTLSGTTLEISDAIGRIAAAGLYMTIVLSGVVSIGLFISARTDNAAGATVAAVVITIVSQILDQIGSLRALHPFLPTHGWRGFTGLFRFPIDWAPMQDGVRVSLAYTCVFMALAVLSFRRRDVMS
jgi:ABC-2 type transport system permease protein